jgi:hypothetical protein
MRFAARASRRLARSIFHGMIWFGPKLERKQAFLFRAVDIALELFALTAALTRAVRTQGADRERTQLMAAQFSRLAHRRIDDVLRDMWSNDDQEKSELARSILAEEHVWLEKGTLGIPFSVDDLRPETMETYLARRHAEEKSEPRRIAPTGT